MHLLNLENLCTKERLSELVSNCVLGVINRLQITLKVFNVSVLNGERARHLQV